MSAPEMTVTVETVDGPALWSFDHVVDVKVWELTGDLYIRRHYTEDNIDRTETLRIAGCDWLHFEAQRAEGAPR